MGQQPGDQGSVITYAIDQYESSRKKELARYYWGQSKSMLVADLHQSWNH